MKTRRTLALLAPVFLLALSASCNAALLSTLISGGNISQGNATYSNFHLNNANPSPLASSITVTASTAASGASVLTFTVTGGAGVWTTPADSSIITFDISFTAPINAVGLDFVATGTSTGIASVGETTTYQFSGQDVSNNLQVVTDGAGSLPDAFSDLESLAHLTTTLSVIKSIDIASSGGAATITSVSNSYFPVPEPASLSLLALAIPFLHRRRA